MSSLSRAIKLTNYSLKKSIILTLIATLIIDILAIIANIYMEDAYIGGLVIGTGKEKLLSIFAINIIIFTIFFLTNAMIIFSESLPVSISYSLTRSNFFKSMIVNSIIASTIFSIVQGILFKVEPILIDYIGKKSINDFILFNTNSDNLFTIIGILFLVTITFISILNFLVSLNYKFGFKVWLLLAGIIIILALIKIGLGISFENLFINLRSLFNKNTKITNFILAGIIFLLFNFLNYLIIKKTNIKYELIKKSI